MGALTVARADAAFSAAVTPIAFAASMAATANNSASPINTVAYAVTGEPMTKRATSLASVPAKPPRPNAIAVRHPRVPFERLRAIRARADHIHHRADRPHRERTVRNTEREHGDAEQQHDAGESGGGQSEQGERRSDAPADRPKPDRSPPRAADSGTCAGDEQHAGEHTRVRTAASCVDCPGVRPKTLPANGSRIRPWALYASIDTKTNTVNRRDSGSAQTSVRAARKLGRACGACTGETVRGPSTFQIAASVTRSAMPATPAVTATKRAGEKGSRSAPATPAVTMKPAIIITHTMVAAAGRRAASTLLLAVREGMFRTADSRAD